MTLRRRLSTSLLPLSSLVLLCLACGSSASSAPSVDTLPATDPSVPDPGPVEPETDPVCVVLAARLQASLDKERGTQMVGHATIGVSTPRCGKTIVFSDEADADVKVGPEWLWQIGSVTKMFVATTVLNLAEAGKLTLEDPVAKYLPDLPNAANITLRHLLSHTSGIFDFVRTSAFNAGLRKDPARAVTPDELIAMAVAQPPNFEPGSGWSYSNTNFVILGRVIEIVTGASLGAGVRAGSLARAGLSQTFLASEEKVVGPQVPGYDYGVVDVSKVNPAWYGAAGAMQSTPSDMLDWLTKLAGDDAVLSTPSRAKMLTMVKTDTPSLRYGLGVVEWGAQLTKSHGIGIGHMGGVAGFASEVIYHPDSKIAIIAFAADTTADMGELVDAAYAGLRALE